MFITKEGQDSATRAISAAGQAYEEVGRTRDAVNQDESMGVYTDDYLAKLREQQAERARQSVERTISGAESSLEKTKQQVTSRLEKMRQVSEPEMAGARDSVSMLLPADPVENYREVLSLYEKLAERKADRALIESLLDRIGLMVDGTKKQAFEAAYAEARRRVEPKLPADEVASIRAVEEIDAALGYLGNVRGVCDAAIKNIADPRQSALNLTHYAKATQFEAEHAEDGSPGASRAIGRAPVGQAS